MTNLKIDKALALAIGYLPEHVGETAGHCVVRRSIPEKWSAYRYFSHLDPTVIWPLAKHYKCFPWQANFASGEWCSSCQDKRFGYAVADTPEAAVALEIIRDMK